jgi:hypothetical protein
MTNRVKLVIATVVAGMIASACCPLDCCLLLLPNPQAQQEASASVPLVNGQARAVAEHAMDMADDVKVASQRY